MKTFILFMTFLGALFLSMNAFGQDNTSTCPFVLFHVIKDDGLFHVLLNNDPYFEINFYLEYGVDPNSDLDGQCFDPYYKSLPEGSTLLHVLAHSFIYFFDKHRIYQLLVNYGADPLAMDKNNDMAEDIDSLYANETHYKSDLFKTQKQEEIVDRSSDGEMVDKSFHQGLGCY